MADALEFFFDFASPYAYLASTRIDDIAAGHGRDVRWRPMMLGAALKRTGGQPLSQVPLKGDYMWRDLPRYARLLGVPIGRPDPMPMNGLAAARAFYWLEAEAPERAKPFARAVFAHHWAEGADASSPEVVAEVAAPLGVDRAALLAGIQDQAVKDRLRAATDEAIARGVFGAPYFFVDGEPFWGSDRLDQIDRWLASGGW